MAGPSPAMTIKKQLIYPPPMATKPTAYSCGDPMTRQPFNVLFLCTANSARSVLAEAILAKVGGDRFRAFSAGSQPRGQINPHALTLLSSLGHDVSQLRSKSWDEFGDEGAPKMDFIFTVCDNAAGEACPFWPGHPATAHWGIPDPASATGSDAQIAVAFNEAYRMLSRRIEAFIALPMDALDQVALQHKLKEIGRMEGATAFARDPSLPKAG